MKANCRICNGKNIDKFLSLGNTPLANSFLKKEELEKEEPRFPLELCFCHNCFLVQLNYVVPPEKMFKNYVYVSSTSNTFRQHFAKMAETITTKFSLGKDSVVVDIGSNDGILLKNFKNFNVDVVGVEPAENIAKIAESEGIETMNDFFSSVVVEKIIKKKGYADIITANNVFAHIDNIYEVAANAKKLLKKDGVFIIEVQYLADMLEKMTFDNIYHEHLSYFSMSSLDYFFSNNEMKIFDVKRVDSHGGSIRVFVKKEESKREVSNNVRDLLEYEKNIGIKKFETYSKFSESVIEVKNKLLAYIKKIKNDGKKIVGYGAPAKSTTLLGFCGIDSKDIDFIIDDSPLKMNLFAPGTHIPVVDQSKIDENMPDYILILAWNFASEIIAKSKKYSDLGVKFIIPLPKPVIV